MSCSCVCNQAIEIIGLCDTTKIEFNDDDRNRNWTEISIPEVLTIPCQKPNVESVEKVFVKVNIISKRVIATPAATDPNSEGTNLTGFKLIVEGIIKQNIVYTADVPEQSVHSAHFDIPFSAFIVLPAADTTLEEKFCVDVCVEDVYVKVFNERDIFKNVTLFLRAYPAPIDPVC
jgi:hypothetical protein